MGPTGFKLMDVSDPTAPKQLGKKGSTGVLNMMMAGGGCVAKAAGNYYVMCGGGGLAVWKLVSDDPVIKEPGALCAKKSTGVTIMESTNTCAVSGKYIYVVGGYGLACFQCDAFTST